MSLNEYLLTLHNAPCSHGGWPSKNTATLSRSNSCTAANQLSRLWPERTSTQLVTRGRTKENISGKWKLVLRQNETNNNGFICPPNHTSSHFPPGSAAAARRRTPGQKSTWRTSFLLRFPPSDFLVVFLDFPVSVLLFWLKDLWSFYGNNLLQLFIGCVLVFLNNAS